MELYVGRQPIKKVDKPISSRVPTMTVLRPTLSPMCPMTKDPTGRAMYATPKLASEARVAVVGLLWSKKTAGKTSAATVP